MPTTAWLRPPTAIERWGRLNLRCFSNGMGEPRRTPWPAEHEWPPRYLPGYAIDDQTAIKVTDGIVDFVSEGHRKRLNS